MGLHNHPYTIIRITGVEILIRLTARTLIGRNQISFLTSESQETAYSINPSLTSPMGRSALLAGGMHLIAIYCDYQEADEWEHEGGVGGGH